MDGFSLPLWVVCVSYGDRHVSELRAQLRKDLSAWPTRTIWVDTAIAAELADGTSVNAVFEFSGYRYGLEQVLQQARSEEAGALGDIAVLFMNDTLVASHSRLAMRVIVPRVAAALQIMSRVACGTATPLPPAMQAISCVDYYFPTFLFGVRGRPDQLDALQFYEPAWTDPGGFTAAYERLPFAYRQAVDRWLNPRGWMEGWYQATPFEPTPAAVLARKRLCILAEHRLTYALQSADLELVDVSKASALYWMAMIWDRAVGNVLKLVYRTRRRLVKSCSTHPALPRQR